VIDFAKLLERSLSAKKAGAAKAAAPKARRKAPHKAGAGHRRAA